MAVLKHHPVAHHCTSLDHLLGGVSHTLTKGTVLELVLAKAGGVDESGNIREWISTGREDEDNGRPVG